jgi:hypothetical protein
MMASNQSAKEAVLRIGVAPAELPHPYRRILDEKRPLRPDHHFIPYGIVSIWVPPLLGAVCLGFTLLTATNLTLALGSAVDLAFILLVLFLSLWGLVWSVRRWQLAQRQRRLLAEGRWKEGLHLLPDALLVFFYQYRKEGPRCFLLPRPAVVEMAIVLERSGGKYPDRKVILRYRDENGQPQPFFLPMVPPPGFSTGYWPSPDQIPKPPPEIRGRHLYYHLEDWIASGEFDWQGES